VCRYAPWALKVCLNGHEWAKRQLQKRGLPFEALDNGFLSCGKPDELQAVCDQLGTHDIEAFLSRWLERLPMPLGKENRQAGYDWRLSIWQMDQPDPGLRSPRSWPGVLRGGDPRQRGPRAPRPCPADLREANDQVHPRLLPHRGRSLERPGRSVERPGRSGWCPAQPAHRVPQHRPEAVLQGRPRAANRDHKGLSNFAYLQQLGRHINQLAGATGRTGRAVTGASSRSSVSARTLVCPPTASSEWCSLPSPTTVKRRRACDSATPG